MSRARVRKTEAKKSQVDYSDELAARLCAAVATGKSLDVACANMNTDPPLTEEIVYLWLFRTPEFAKAYREAKKSAMMKFLEDTIAIADDDSGDTITTPGRGEDRASYEAPNSAAVNRAKLKVQARQWAMKNLEREIFGDVKPGAGDGGETVIKIVGGLPD